MKILNTEQLRTADRYTMEHEPIDSIDLMERASQVFVDALLELPLHFDDTPIRIICGVGNNGGDGLAIARHLHADNYRVEAWNLHLGSGSEEYQTNLQHWSLLGESQMIESADDLPEILDHYIVIDAIFGSGINRPVVGFAADVINHINHSKATIISVDMPSGLYVDEHQSEGAIVKADYTLSFQNPKLAFFLPQNNPFVGQWNIGVDPDYLNRVETNYKTIDYRELKKFAKAPHKFDHKGTYGHALLVAGSKGKVGAAILAARAAFKCGLGLLTVHVPRNRSAIMNTALPEAMVSADSHADFTTSISPDEAYRTAGIGPGLGTADSTASALQSFLKVTDYPVVLDADALNIISRHPEMYAMIPENSILTPHPKEFRRLMGKVNHGYHRLELQMKLAQEHKLIVVYKGAHTTISLPDGRVYFNNNGMATGGSGDVLTGMITGLLCRLKDPEAAALLGVYLHGSAGDEAASEKGTISMMASDILDQISAAFKKLDLPL